MLYILSRRSFHFLATSAALKCSAIIGQHRLWRHDPNYWICISDYFYIFTELHVFLLIYIYFFVQLHQGDTEYAVIRLYVIRCKAAWQQLRHGEIILLIAHFSEVATVAFIFYIEYAVLALTKESQHLAITWSQLHFSTTKMHENRIINQFYYIKRR